MRLLGLLHTVSRENGMIIIQRAILCDVFFLLQFLITISFSPPSALVFFSVISALVVQCAFSSSLAGYHFLLQLVFSRPYSQRWLRMYAFSYTIQAQRFAAFRGELFCALVSWELIFGPTRLSWPLERFLQPSRCSPCRRWSSSGCSVVATNASDTACSCNHLTNFAVLMQTRETEVSGDVALVWRHFRWSAFVAMTT